MTKHILVNVAEESAQSVVVHTSMAYEMQPIAQLTINDDVRA